MCPTKDHDSGEHRENRPSAGLHSVVAIPSRCAIGLVRLYQILLGPLLGRHCRFDPTCSQYSILVFRKYGFLRGMLKTAVRILKCHPWHPGGTDLP